MSLRPCLAALSLALPAAAQEPVLAAGDYFTVRAYGLDERTAAQAVGVVDRVWPAVCEVFGVEPDPPPARLQVHLYADLDDYLRADRRLTGGRFGPNQAMAHWDSKSAHVALQPPTPAALLAARGLPLQTLAMLAWEASHIARFELCPNFRVHPGWFHDGLAASISRRVLSAQDPRADEQPFFTQRWLRVQRLADQGDLVGVRQLLVDEVNELSMRDRYAERVTFFHCAEQARPARVRALAQVIRETAAGPRYAATVEAAAQGAFEGVDARFRARATGLRLRWDEEVRSLWRVGDELRQRAFPDADAVALCNEPVLGGGIRASGAVRVDAVGPASVALLFAVTDRSGYRLALTGGRGFTLFEDRFGDDTSTVVATGRTDGVRAGAFVAFELAGRGRDLTLRLAGERWPIQLPRPLPDELRWGIRAESGGAGGRYGSSGAWRGLMVGPR